MVTAIKAKDVERQAIQAAAEEYVARQEMRSHPAMEEDAKNRFHIADREIRPCCTKYLKRRYELNQHCRSAIHVANLFDVNVDAMMEQVIALKKE
jgi:hypothetical protein